MDGAFLTQVTESDQTMCWQRCEPSTALEITDKLTWLETAGLINL